MLTRVLQEMRFMELGTGDSWQTLRRLATQSNKLAEYHHLEWGGGTG